MFYMVVILKDSLCIRMTLLNAKERIEFRKPVLIGLSMEILSERYYSYLSFKNIVLFKVIIIIISFILIRNRLFKL